MQYPEGPLGRMELGPAGEAQGIAPLLVRPVLTDEVVHWDRLMAAHHYLGVRRLVGESLRYVAEQGGQWLALLGWGSAAFKCAPRDRWIGWTPEQHWRRLRYVANNLRFLVLPDARQPNVASQVLGANLRRLSRDWQAVFGHPILLVETFVDPRFAGTCYHAAGWQELGLTRGYRRNGGRYYFHGQPKRILVRLLHRRGREWLTAAFDVPSLCPGGSSMLDLNSLVEAHGGLVALLEGLPDPRKRRGIRHRQASVLAVAICACLTGARSFVAIGEWAAALPQEALQRFGSRLHPKRLCYVPPSEPTLRRALKAVDADRLDQELGEWLERRAPGSAVAVDGKSLRGALGQNGRPMHLLSALVHKEGVVIGQRLVDPEHNEITEFKPLLAPLEITGKVVTADAMHAQREHARFLVEDKHADYVFTVKNNQPTLLADLEALDQDAFSPSVRGDRQGPRPA
jgi:Domain of unknown function (DUF4338)/DDE_Tnp_1-associated/Transposase DDE domain